VHCLLHCASTPNAEVDDIPCADKMQEILLCCDLNGTNLTDARKENTKK